MNQRIVANSCLIACLATLLACSARQSGPETSPAGSEPGLAEQPAPVSEPVDATRAAALYEELAKVEREYEAGIEFLSNGAEILGEETIALATERLFRTARECSGTPGCDVEPFFASLEGLLARQELVMKHQAAEIDDLVASAAKDVDREPGTLPFVAAMPEIDRTTSMLRGTDLTEIITLNGPVNAALDDWLTWMRPMLMDSYINYQFLKPTMLPVYEEAGLPEALLFAMLATETGGKVHSFSRAGAAGPLQFMRYTGRHYGLSVVDGFDLRLDPEAATRANVAYLNDRFKELNDNLEKALGAYNGGEGRMRTLHRRLGDISFWDSRLYYALPTETREYVPRIFAAAWLFMHPEQYNLEWPALDTETVSLVLDRELSLGELTICFGQHQNPRGWFRTLRNLNPEVNPGDRLKVGTAVEVPALLEPLYAEGCAESDLMTRAGELHEANYPDGSELIQYTVRRGDTLGKIAGRHRCVSIRELAALNNVRAPRYVIQVGQRLKVPRCS